MSRVAEEILEENIHQLVSFKLGEEEYGVKIAKVHEIITMIPITKLPRSGEYVDGVINLRGNIITVINLHRRFGIPEKESDGLTRIMVVEIKGRTVGLIVDSVTEVMRVADDLLQDPPESASQVNEKFISKVAKMNNRLIILLSLDEII